MQNYKQTIIALHNMPNLDGIRIDRDPLLREIKQGLPGSSSTTKEWIQVIVKKELLQSSFSSSSTSAAGWSSSSVSPSNSVVTQQGAPTAQPRPVSTSKDDMQRYVKQHVDPAIDRITIKIASVLQILDEAYAAQDAAEETTDAMEAAASSTTLQATPTNVSNDNTQFKYKDPKPTIPKLKASWVHDLAGAVEAEMQLDDSVGPEMFGDRFFNLDESATESLDPLSPFLNTTGSGTQQALAIIRSLERETPPTKFFFPSSHLTDLQKAGAVYSNPSSDLSTLLTGLQNGDAGPLTALHKLELEVRSFNEGLDSLVNVHAMTRRVEREKAWEDTLKVLETLKEVMRKRGELLVGAEGLGKRMKKFQGKYEKELTSFEAQWSSGTERWNTKSKNNKKKGGDSGVGSAGGDDVEAVDQVWDGYIANLKCVWENWKSEMIYPILEELEDMIQSYKTQLEQGLEDLTKMKEDSETQDHVRSFQIGDMERVMRNHINGFRVEVSNRWDPWVLGMIESLETIFKTESQPTVRGRLEKAANPNFKKKVKELEHELARLRQNFPGEVMEKCGDLRPLLVPCFKVLLKCFSFNMMKDAAVRFKAHEIFRKELVGESQSYDVEVGGKGKDKRGGDKAKENQQVSLGERRRRILEAQEKGLKVGIVSLGKILVEQLLKEGERVGMDGGYGKASKKNAAGRAVVSPAVASPAIAHVQDLDGDAEESASKKKKNKKKKKGKGAAANNDDYDDDDAGTEQPVAQRPLSSAVGPVKAPYVAPSVGAFARIDDSHDQELAPPKPQLASAISNHTSGGGTGAAVKPSNKNTNNRNLPNSQISSAGSKPQTPKVEAQNPQQQTVQQATESTPKATAPKSASSVTSTSNTGSAPPGIPTPITGKAAGTAQKPPTKTPAPAPTKLQGKQQQALETTESPSQSAASTAKAATGATAVYTSTPVKANQMSKPSKTTQSIPSQSSSASLYTPPHKQTQQENKQKLYESSHPQPHTKVQPKSASSTTTLSSSVSSSAPPPGFENVNLDSIFTPPASLPPNLGLGSSSSSSSPTKPSTSSTSTTTPATSAVLATSPSLSSPGATLGGGSGVSGIWDPPNLHSLPRTGSLTNLQQLHHHHHHHRPASPFSASSSPSGLLLGGGMGNNIGGGGGGGSVGVVSNTGGSIPPGIGSSSLGMGIGMGMGGVGVGAGIQNNVSVFQNSPPTYQDNTAALVGGVLLGGFSSSSSSLSNGSLDSSLASSVGMHDGNINLSAQQHVQQQQQQQKQQQQQQGCGHEAMLVRMENELRMAVLEIQRLSMENRRLVEMVGELSSSSSSSARNTNANTHHENNSNGNSSSNNNNNNSNHGSNSHVGHHHHHQHHQHHQHQHVDGSGRKSGAGVIGSGRPSGVVNGHGPQHSQNQNQNHGHFSQGWRNKGKSGGGYGSKSWLVASVRCGNCGEEGHESGECTAACR
jgi:hypothetical protein